MCLQFIFLLLATIWFLDAFQVISEESESSNLIVLLKDVELLAKSGELHASLRSELPRGVLIIGSHTQADSRNDQV